jgi:hypothetical protein
VKALSSSDLSLHYETRRITNAAIVRGEIKRPTLCERCRCICSPDGHHRNYEDPFDIEWLCLSCHQDEHRQQELAKSDNRETSLRIRLSAQEKHALEDKAWRARKSVSAYVRNELQLNNLPATAEALGAAQKENGER